ncbi:MAG: dihydrodipicolinate synthase family protein [Planctomycetes bacterium]|nr:dihydrodipicolinate synthase family protein [Planctomycetota bacterium]
MRENEFQATGVIPACLMPFDADLEIDESAYRRHLRDLAGVDGVSAIAVNGHAAEVHALTNDEQKRSLEIAYDEIGTGTSLVAGISTTSCRDAARLAKMATAAGASALLVFPSEVLSFGGQLCPKMALAHVSSIAEASALPLILFQYPLAGGLGYPIATLRRLCIRIPTICAIKDWCNDPPLHERHIRELHSLDRRVNVLSTHSAWLLGSLAMGCDGLLSGAGSVIANLQVGLWRAVQRGDLHAAQAINDRIYPTVLAFYRAPLVNMHNRMKEALVLLGRLDAAHVRPPLVKLQRHRIKRIGRLLDEAGINPQTVYKPIA